MEVRHHKVLQPHHFVLSRLRRRKGWSCCLKGGRGQKGGEYGRGVRRGRHAPNSVWSFCLLISLNVRLYGTTISFTFSTSIIKGSWSLKKSKAVLNNWPDYLMSVCFLALFLLCLLPHRLASVRKHSSPSSRLLLIPLVFLLALELIL